MVSYEMKEEVVVRETKRGGRARERKWIGRGRVESGRQSDR